MSITLKISKENYKLLSDMIALAETRQPVQGEFDFEIYNAGDELRTVEGIAHCGTVGCLAGGYLPLINKERFYFDEDGRFSDGDEYFENGKLAKELGKEVYRALFWADYQYKLGLKNLSYDATLEEVVENAKKVLALLQVKE